MPAGQVTSKEPQTLAGMNLPSDAPHEGEKARLHKKLRMPSPHNKTHSIAAAATIRRQAMSVESNSSSRLSNGALVNGAVVLGVAGALHQEAHNLHLLLVVEGDQADVGLGEGALALANLLQDLAGVSAAEHGQLPHGPVPVVLVTSGDSTEADARPVSHVGVGRLGELQGRNPAVAHNVVNLASDLLVAQGGQVGEGLVLLVVGWLPDHHAVSLGGSNGGGLHGGRLQAGLDGSWATSHHSGASGRLGKDGGHFEVPA
mmetsp:Transcript_21921/g.47848  ORF Transcript_21921/g.47848 Transcript_21921/m.47848 type:complete len:259 (-) Transcript_21921:31-807(-)